MPGAVRRSRPSMALRSGAAQWAPWDLLVEDLRDANRAMIEVMESAPEEPPSAGAPTVKTAVVALRRFEDGRTEPQIFFAELGWKEYALLQRLHLLDHRTQIKNLQAMLREKEFTAEPRRRLASSFIERGEFSKTAR